MTVWRRESGITDYSAKASGMSSGGAVIEASERGGHNRLQVRTGRYGTCEKQEAAAASARFFPCRNTAAEPGEEPLSENAGIMAQADSCRRRRKIPGRQNCHGKEERQPAYKTGILAQLAELDDQAEKRRSVSADSSCTRPEGCGRV
ncbi:MAG: hypothetical protein ACLUD2_16775, partial [Clostridium sp.]